jgi:hypothetical protein
MSRDYLGTLSEWSYGELLAALRKDLQLDPLVDLLPSPGLAVTSQELQANQALVWDGSKWNPQTVVRSNVVQAQSFDVDVGAQAGAGSSAIALPTAFASNHYRDTISAWFVGSPAVTFAAEPQDLSHVVVSWSGALTGPPYSHVTITAWGS